MSYTACAAPYARVMIYGIIPMPLWGVVVGFFLYDLYGASRRSVCPDNRGAGITLMKITVWIERQLCRTHRRYRRRDCHVFPESRGDPLGLIGPYRGGTTCTLVFSVVPTHQ